MNLYNKVFIIFLDVIPSLNVIERHLRDIAAFIISDTILFNIFLSQVDWNSEKGNIIAVMNKSSGVYLMLQVQLFNGRRELKQKLHERKRNRKLN